ncbi:hypothetical protein [Downy mildew lesion associated ormycovirus 3]|uniref:Uncharacterized protein n=1 Tax=Downy mildew lesion associated ormycovirus 3 TaxID=3162771 RepID=A0AAT9QE72_9VIRU|nr:hypothetical protein [Plasmopara viticola lesion-associated ormycovirus 3]
MQSLGKSLELHFTSSDISNTERLVNALNKERITKDPDNPIVSISGNRIAVRSPQIEEKDLGSLDNLGKYLKWAVTILGMKDPEVRYIMDPEVGKTCSLPAKVERMMDNTIAALTLPPSEVGDRAEFKTGFKANVVELLAAIRLMRRYGSTLQKQVAPKGHKSVQVTTEDLKSSLNGRAGLLEKGTSDFCLTFVKAVFNELTKPNGKSFPGKWVASVKASNKTKSNLGVLYKLGYETRVVNVQKVMSVVTHDVVLKDSLVPELWKKKDDGKVAFRFRDLSVLTEAQRKKLPELPKADNSNTEVVPIPGKIRMSASTTHREFRLACMMLLPLIDPKSEISPKDQLNTDPLSVKSKHILAYYSSNRDVVDATNLAYATYKAIGVKGSKATNLGFRSARGHAISLSANRVWMDKTGKEYKSFMEIPEHTRDFLLKFGHRILSENDDEESDAGEYQTAEEKNASPKGESSTQK